MAIPGPKKGILATKLTTSARTRNWTSTGRPSGRQDNAAPTGRRRGDPDQERGGAGHRRRGRHPPPPPRRPDPRDLVGHAGHVFDFARSIANTG